MVGRIYPLGYDRVKISENLDATFVAPVAPVVPWSPPQVVKILAFVTKNVSSSYKGFLDQSYEKR